MSMSTLLKKLPLYRAVWKSSLVQNTFPHDQVLGAEKSTICQQINASISRTRSLGSMDGQVGYRTSKLILLESCRKLFPQWISDVSQVDENSSTGKISLGLSVIVRVTLRDGTFHEVHA